MNCRQCFAPIRLTSPDETLCGCCYVQLLIQKASEELAKAQKIADEILLMLRGQELR